MIWSTVFKSSGSFTVSKANKSAKACLKFLISESINVASIYPQGNLLEKISLPVLAQLVDIYRMCSCVVLLKITFVKIGENTVLTLFFSFHKNCPNLSGLISIARNLTTYAFFARSRSSTAFSSCARIGFNKICLRLKLALFTIKREDTLQISSKGSKPLARKVFPYPQHRRCNHLNQPKVQVP